MRHISSTTNSQMPGEISSATLWMFWQVQHEHAPGSVYSCTASATNLAARGSRADFATVATAWACALLTAGLVAARAADIRACNQQVRLLSSCTLTQPLLRYLSACWRTSSGFKQDMQPAKNVQKYAPSCASR